MLTQRRIIQGGMGVGVSSSLLAKKVSLLGGIGTVSGTAAAHFLANALRKGNQDCLRALFHFPFRDVSRRVIDAYWEKRKTVPMFGHNPSKSLIELTICANFAIVWLAKEGHGNPVFINFLEKIQFPHIYSILGAMLAGVDGIVMGAGIPKQIPSVIDAVLSHQELSYKLDVEGDKAGYVMRFNPKELGGELPKMKRPVFLPIVSSSTLAKALKKSCHVDGFIVEMSTAGGHNAPSRGKEKRFDEKGNLLYDLEGKDRIDHEKIRSLGLPFWIGGSFASPSKLQEALSLGASGIQVGTLFAFSEESGIKKNLKRQVVRGVLANRIAVLTSHTASPTGFPFKVVQLDGTLSDPEVYKGRTRICNLGYLRKLCMVNGELVLRCSAEPEEDYVRKGGQLKDTECRMCLCNGLCATVGIENGNEAPVLTSGDDLSGIRQIVKCGNDFYTASDVMKYLLGGL